MAAGDERVVALLEELVDLQRKANEQQQQAVLATAQYYADARQRTQAALDLQQVAVTRQRWFVRVWLGMIVFVIACVAGLLVAVSRYLH